LTRDSPAQHIRMNMSSDPTQRFSDRVENYEKYRPRYPKAFFDYLRDELGLFKGSAVADVGSGTGISAETLVERGIVVYAIEPNAPMREAAERKLAKRPNFKSVNSTAEETTLPDRSVDLVLAAQAFHWFDKPRAKAEFKRILKSGGRVALVWNERKLDASPFLTDYESMLLQFGTDYKAIRHENVTEEVLTEFFAPHGFETRVFENSQDFDYAGLQGRLLSSSYVPAPGQGNYEQIIKALKSVFDRHQKGGKVRMEYETRVRVGKV